MIKRKIQELEFKVALEEFCAVARLVPKDEVRKNPKANSALDKEWENLRTKGVWDESRVRECKSIVDEARKNNETVHFCWILKPVTKKVPNFLQTTFDESSRDALSFRETTFVIKIQIMRCLQSLVPAQHRWKLQNSLMRLVHNLDFQKLRQAYIQALFTGVPAWLSLLRNRWPEHWSKEFWQPMVPLVLALHGHPDSGGIWENHLNPSSGKEGWNNFFLTFGKVALIMLNASACWLSMWTISNLQVRPRTWTKHGPAFVLLSTLGNQSHMTDILAVNMWSSTTLHSQERLTLLHMFLILRRL